MGKSIKRDRKGFTLVELLIFIVLASLIAAGLYEVVRFQQRAYRQHTETVERHDALRLASAVLVGDIAEASGREGDFAAIADDSIALRSPTGFGIICAQDPSDRRIALTEVSGIVGSSAGDSLLVYHPDGWLVRAIQDVNPQSAASLTCPYGGGQAPDITLRLAESVSDVPVGAPVRAFRRHSYRLEQRGDTWWLARDDGTFAWDWALAGPLTADSGLAFAYFDSTGQATTDPTHVALVDLTIVAATVASDKRDTLTVSVRPRNQ
jgi:prepilin-type N-terminal cleavage/methylation domain-containing protein